MQYGQFAMAVNLKQTLTCKSNLPGTSCNLLGTYKYASCIFKGFSIVVVIACSKQYAWPFHEIESNCSTRFCWTINDTSLQANVLVRSSV